MTAKERTEERKARAADALIKAANGRYVTYKESQITDNPKLIEGLKFISRDSEARTRTFETPEPYVKPEPKPEPKKEPEKPKGKK